ncbi:MAG: hypothetical protein WCI77_01950 [Candidatus Omnitrophota bacterium]
MNFMFRNSFKLFSKNTTQKQDREFKDADAFPKVGWLEAHQNRFGMRVLDCRSFSRSALCFAPDYDIAKKFLKLRSSTGENYRDQLPKNMLHIRCNFRYRFEERIPDGPVSIAKAMQDRWDVYLYDSFLYFTNSWSGELLIRAKVDFKNNEFFVSAIDICSDLANRDKSLAVRQVDYLIKSHLYRYEVPNPLPRDFPNDSKQIALYSFSFYGRMSSYATYEDTTLIKI